MRFSWYILPWLALSVAAPPASGHLEPVAAPGEPYSSASIVGRTLEKRAVSARVETDGLKYRTCPRTSCDTIGQYSIGSAISITCYTRDRTTPINGDTGWAKLTNGYWSALSYGNYVAWSSSIPYC
ncbi:hypothetical protein B0H34DRAFT_794473 [Crassisporium funariophilum]|nr:hypothetical protein B0H34DRAFT_794473 [Crassisporium funariophilum]